MPNIFDSFSPEDAKLIAGALVTSFVLPNGADTLVEHVRQDLPRLEYRAFLEAQSLLVEGLSDEAINRSLGRVRELALAAMERAELDFDVPELS